MLSRWNIPCVDINVVLRDCARLSALLPQRRRRGRPPKRPPATYLALLIGKEYERRSLRDAEHAMSERVCGERIDHSVLAYWEKQTQTSEQLTLLVRLLGRLLARRLPPLFGFVDSTKFSNWRMQETEVTVCNHIACGTVYPVGVSFRRESVAAAVIESVPRGTGPLYADAWYDVNEVFRVLFEKGYLPIICPNKNRVDGFYRRKGRKLYRMRTHRLGYRQRSRGESVFGSLTNWFGDRLTARHDAVMRSRSAARLIAYQLKIIMRVNYVLHT